MGLSDCSIFYISVSRCHAVTQICSPEFAKFELCYTAKYLRTGLRFRSDKFANGTKSVTVDLFSHHKFWLC